MKRTKIVFSIIGLFAVSAVKAQDYKMALGVRLSSSDAVINNSITAKYFISSSSAIEGLLSFDPVAIGALYEKYNPLNLEGLTWFYGGGAYVGFSRGKNLGAQGIVGLDYKVQVAPIDVSLDWKPELNLIRGVSFEPAAVGLSVRFTLGGEKE